MDKRIVSPILQAFNKEIVNCNRDVEIAQDPGCQLGSDKFFYVRMADMKNAHIGAGTDPVAVNQVGGLVKEFDKGEGSACNA